MENWGSRRKRAAGGNIERFLENRLVPVAISSTAISSGGNTFQSRGDPLRKRGEATANTTRVERSYQQNKVNNTSVATTNTVVREENSFPKPIEGARPYEQNRPSNDTSLPDREMNDSEQNVVPGPAAAPSLESPTKASKPEHDTD